TGGQRAPLLIVGRPVPILRLPTCGSASAPVSRRPSRPPAALSEGPSTPGTRTFLRLAGRTPGSADNPTDVTGRGTSLGAARGRRRTVAVRGRTALSPERQRGAPFGRIWCRPIRHVGAPLRIAYAREWPSMYRTPLSPSRDPVR